MANIWSLKDTDSELVAELKKLVIEKDAKIQELEKKLNPQVKKRDWFKCGKCGGRKVAAASKCLKPCPGFESTRDDDGKSDDNDDGDDGDDDGDELKRAKQKVAEIEARRNRAKSRTEGKSKSEGKKPIQKSDEPQGSSSSPAQMAGHAAEKRAEVLQLNSF